MSITKLYGSESLSGIVVEILRETSRVNIFGSILILRKIISEDIKLSHRAYWTKQYILNFMLIFIFFELCLYLLPSSYI